MMRRLFRGAPSTPLSLSAGVAVLACAVACASQSSSAPATPVYGPPAPYGQPYGAQPYGTQPYGAQAGTQPYGGQPYGAQPGYGTPAPTNTQANGAPYTGQPYGQQPAPAAPAPLPAAPQYAASNDWISLVELNALRGSAQGILNELVMALPATQQGRVLGIPMVFDPTPGEVNAFAACTEGGKSLMAMTDGLLDVTAHLAQAAANDELFGTRKVDEYISLVAQNQRPGQPMVRTAPGFFDAAQASDARRIARQHAIFEEQIAFVLGHELAHHYLGHLPCTASGPVAVTASQLGNALSGALPLLNQPNELAADVAGTNNVLTTGKRRASFHWTEGGAMLTMRFFTGLEHYTPEDLMFAFENSHPPALIRQPVILQTASAWRSTGGAQLFPF